MLKLLKEKRSTMEELKKKNYFSSKFRKIFLGAKNTSRVYDSSQINSLKITNDLREYRIRISRTQEWQDGQCEGVEFCLNFY